jgi:hypothetical protein
LRALLNSSSFGGLFRATKDYLQPVLALMAVSIPIFAHFDDYRREALVIGLVYFCIYMLTSLASRRAFRFNNRFSSLSTTVNVSYLIGIGLLIFSGIMTRLEFSLAAVVLFIGLYVINSIRRPINVGLISDQISSNVMASGLSTEAQLTTMFSALFAPLLGFLADSFGVGNSIALVGLGMLLLFSLVRVKDPE